MKQKLLLLLLLLLTAFSFQAFGENYFTIGDNDRLRVNPNRIGQAMTVPVRAHFDGRLDFWQITISMTNPNGIELLSLSDGPDMKISYIDSSGSAAIHQASFMYDASHAVVTGNTTVYGYWDYDGNQNFVPYGKVKWEAGDYDEMFDIHCLPKASIAVNDTITFSIFMSASPDLRGGIVNNYVQLSKHIVVYLGFMKGDVNGDESINITDVNILNSRLNNNTLDDLGQYGLEAADLNDDGDINITDLTLLVSLALSNE